MTLYSFLNRESALLVRRVKSCRLFSFIRQKIACRRLQTMVDSYRNSFEGEQYRRKREAGKKGWAHRLAADRAAGLRPQPLRVFAEQHPLRGGDA